MRTALLIGVLAGALTLPGAVSADSHWHGHDHGHGSNVHISVNAWHGGYWWHGPYLGVASWWWVTNGLYFRYAAPVYPYPAYQPYPAYYAPYAAPYPAYQPAYPAYAPPEPPQYAGPPEQTWYYCDRPRGYYPYVRDCASGWHPVAASPPNG